jgi:hypothetical protein
MEPTEKRKAILDALVDDARNRRLLSPAESLNALTIGAAQEDGSTYHPATDIFDPFFQSDIPSPISSYGPGYLRAVKPDVLFPGGRQLLREKKQQARPILFLE